MSASSSPQNPGTPRHNPNIRKASALSRFGPRILAGGTVLGLVYAYYATKPPVPGGTPAPPNPLRTPGVQNIEGAYQSGGATSTHTKGYGGTPLGQKSDVPRDGNHGSAKEKGFDEEDLGADQRPNAGGKVGDKWNEMKYGNSKGK